MLVKLNPGAEDILLDSYIFSKIPTALDVK